MKRKISIFIAALVSVIMIAVVINSCKKSSLETIPSSTLTQPGVSTPASDAKSLNPDKSDNNLSKPQFNLDVILRSVNQGDDKDLGEDQRDDHNGGEGRSFGRIKFRQDKDTPKIISLDVMVHGLQPNHSYQLQRAVDTNLDGNCTSTTWLTLGKGLTPQSILTDEKGKGQEDLWRDVSSAASGATFDIHFQIIDEVTLAVVLTSDCYQYTVR